MILKNLTNGRKRIMDNEEFFKKVQEECKNMDNYATDWQKVRIQAAIAAMQGMCASKSFFRSPMNVFPKLL